MAQALKNSRAMLDAVLPAINSCCHPLCCAPLQGNLDLYSDPWPKISAEAKDCVRRMLEMDPAKVDPQPLCQIWRRH